MTKTPKTRSALATLKATLFGIALTASPIALAGISYDTDMSEAERACMKAPGFTKEICIWGYETFVG